MEKSLKKNTPNKSDIIKILNFWKTVEKHTFKMSENQQPDNKSSLSFLKKTIRYVLELAS